MTAGHWKTEGSAHEHDSEGSRCMVPGADGCCSRLSRDRSDNRKVWAALSLLSAPATSNKFAAASRIMVDAHSPSIIHGDMESNGKSVTKVGQRVNHQTVVRPLSLPPSTNRLVRRSPTAHHLVLVHCSAKALHVQVQSGCRPPVDGYPPKILE